MADTASTPSAKRTKTVVEAQPAPSVAATPVGDAPEPEEATAATSGAAATEIAPLPAAPATAAPVDEVTITGCLEISKDEDRFRLADTEGESAPRARSWRSGFRKRAAPVDLIVSTEAASLYRRVGQRIAATGVLTSRTLKVSSVRVVSPSCN